MRTILVLNSKGGSGKTTVATHLAAWYALKGKAVSLVDLDPQGSSYDWCMLRDESLPYIHPIPGWEQRIRHPRGTEVAVIDAPAGVHGADLSPLLKRAETLLMPVLPSPIDLRAAQRFTEELNHTARVQRRRIRLGTLINRAREKSQGRVVLEDYLRHLRLPDGRRLPFVGVLRASQNYLNAAEQGLSVFELTPSAAKHDLELWRPVLRWLNSKHSRPAG